MRPGLDSVRTLARSWAGPLTAWGRAALDVVYPRSCAACGAETEEEGFLCWNCISRIQYVSLPFCSICGDPVAGRVDRAYICYTCTDSTPHFAIARSAARYRDTVQELLRAFKYRGALWLRPDLTHILESCARNEVDWESVDVVTAVPLFWRRRLARGYNQAALLAGDLARRLGRPFEGRILRRVRSTDTQTHLTARERATNVEGAFQVRRPARIEQRRVLLVDDVMTTGATVNECARVLMKAGAGRVDVVTVARG